MLREYKGLFLLAVFCVWWSLSGMRGWCVILLLLSGCFVNVMVGSGEW